jgi:GNAT superfamily N-acetyltransferase
VDREELLARNLESLRGFVAAIGRSAESSRVLAPDGVVASLTPAAPDRSIVNSVVYHDADALEAALGGLSGAYEQAGVSAWTVWVPEEDERAASLLEGAGHHVDADPAAMAILLDEWDGAGPREGEGSDVDTEATMVDVAPINDRAYGFDEVFTRALAGWRDEVYVYLWRDAGRAVSSAVTMDVGDDCGVFFVATLPEARGRGLATALMRRALAEARDRGRTTSTLQATKAGQPIYERLGYRNLGALQMWERRSSGRR